jgi:DNA-directed RNA polymerase subunit RPC12/RpoP
MAFDDIITTIYSCKICGHKGDDVEYTTDPLASKSQTKREDLVYMCLKCLKHLREGTYEAITKSM